MKGVFLIGREFSRAFNLKLGLDARVTILANDKSLGKAEALQMCGRGSRSQGTGHGHLFLKHSPNDPVNAWEVLRSFSQAKKTNGGKTLRRLFAWSKELSTTDVVHLVRGFENKNWAINDQDWKMEYL